MIDDVFKAAFWENVQPFQPFLTTKDAVLGIAWDPDHHALRNLLSLPIDLYFSSSGEDIVDFSLLVPMEGK